MGKAAPPSVLDPEHEFIALDTVADILRACGENAFDTHKHTGDSARKQAELWARHLLLGGPHPENPRITGRDFLGVRAFVRQLRGSEAEFVRSALRDFRSMISSVFNNIERALLADGEGDKQMKTQLARLRGAVESSSLEQLRREVLAVSSDLSSLLGTRACRPRHPRAAA
jgi:HPt (histidine-containing phosphotransfer) domain-containing protein